MPVKSPARVIEDAATLATSERFVVESVNGIHNALHALLTGVFELIGGHDGHYDGTPMKPERPNWIPNPIELVRPVTIGEMTYISCRLIQPYYVRRHNTQRSPTGMWLLMLILVTEEDVNSRLGIYITKKELQTQSRKHQFEGVRLDLPLHELRELYEVVSESLGIAIRVRIAEIDPTVKEHQAQLALLKQAKERIIENLSS